MAPWSPQRLRTAVEDVLTLIEPGNISEYAWTKVRDIFDEYRISEQTPAHIAVIQPLLRDTAFTNVDIDDPEIVHDTIRARLRSEPNQASHQQPVEVRPVGAEPTTGRTAESPGASKLIKNLPVFYLGESNKVYTNGARLFGVLRGAVAAADEGLLSRIASGNKHFVRGSEKARIDCGIFVSRSAPDIQDTTERFFHYFDNYRSSKSALFLPIEIKSLSPLPKIRLGDKLSDIKRIEFSIKLLPEQFKHCQWVLLTSATDPSTVAPFPIHNLQMISSTDFGKNKHFDFPRMSFDMVYANALPPEAMWAEMPRAMLPLFIENLVQFALDSTQTMINPFTKLPYYGLPIMKMTRFPLLLSVKGIDDPELILQRKLWHAFKLHGAASKLKIRFPESNPYTSDIEVVHESGLSVFIELKQALCEVRQSSTSRATQLLHFPQNVGRGRAIFLYSAVWDFILTELDDGSAVMLSKDDIPRSWWHQDPGEGKPLKQRYLNDSFINKHKVELNDARLLVAQAGRILRGADSTTSDAAPVPAKLTGSDIMKMAGPVPTTLLPFREMEIEESDEENDEGGGEEEAAAEKQLREAIIWGRKWEGVQQLYPNMQRARSGGDDITFESMFFNAVMHQCRLKKRGIICDFGLRHPLGRFGFVDWQWSDTDCLLFDQGVTVPKRMGNLGSNIPVLPLFIAWTPWKLGAAPLEPARSNFDAIKLADDCIIVMDAAPKLDGHKPHSRFVVPSQFFPDEHQGRLKFGNRLGYRGKLFLKEKHSVDSFICEESDLLDTFYRFFAEPDITTIGLGGIEVETKRYLRTVGECKFCAIINFSTMGRVGDGEDVDNEE